MVSAIDTVEVRSIDADDVDTGIGLSGGERAVGERDALGMPYEESVAGQVAPYGGLRVTTLVLLELAGVAPILLGKSVASHVVTTAFEVARCAEIAFLQAPSTLDMHIGESDVLNAVSGYACDATAERAAVPALHIRDADVAQLTDDGVARRRCHIGDGPSATIAQPDIDGTFGAIDEQAIDRNVFKHRAIDHL